MHTCILTAQEYSEDTTPLNGLPPCSPALRLIPGVIHVGAHIKFKGWGEVQGSFLETFQDGPRALCNVQLHGQKRGREHEGMVTADLGGGQFVSQPPHIPVARGGGMW